VAYPNRFVCDVLEEMRSCHKTRNFSYLPGLIEEAQMMVDNMEASLKERKEYIRWHQMVKEEKSEYKRLLKETNKLRKKAGEACVNEDE
jgi:hypothetical protein